MQKGLSIKRESLRLLILGFCVGIPLSVAIVRCYAGEPGVQPRQAQPPSGLNLSFSSKEALAPDAAPGRDATLVMAGVQIPVTVEARRSGDKITLVMLAHGEVIEDEVFRSTDNSFELVSGAGETYSPPIPLLRFPLKTGDSWTWNGTMSAGGVVRKAKSAVYVQGERIGDGTGEKDAVKSLVELQMESGGPEPAIRKLSFWFVPGQGLVKREFGEKGIGSARTPGHPKPETETEE